MRASEFQGLHRWLAPLLLVLSTASAHSSAASTCYGTTANGALRDGCRLPIGAPNVAAYTTLGVTLGRMWVHCDVAAVVEQSYAALAESHPDRHFTLGESWQTPWRRVQAPQDPPQRPVGRLHGAGGRPAPVSRSRCRPACATSSATPSSSTPRGRHSRLTLDFEAIAAHLSALRVAAQEAGVGISRVIFDPALRARLEGTQAWPSIRDLPFSTRQAWVRHDEHYHVDFEIPCRPMAELRR